MKPLILLLCIATLPGWSQNPFDQARDAYDNGEFPQALSFYQEIEGFSAAVDYNIGNTLMRLNRYPEAIAYYRRALWQKNGDPDIRTNLARAVAETEAVIPPLPVSLRIAGFLNTAQWQWLLIASCWLFASLGLLQRWIRLLRHISAWTLPLTGGVMLICAAGIWATRPSQWMQEAVVKETSLTTRFEPLPDATEHFSLPGGSVVHLENRSRNWYRISAADKSGWVPVDQVILLQDLP